MTTTERTITGWLLLKDLPGADAFTVGKLRNDCYFGTSNQTWDFSTFRCSEKVMMPHPDFFLPIHDDEELCGGCNGSGRVPDGPAGSWECSTCHGQRVVKKQPKIKCNRCEGCGTVKYPLLMSSLALKKPVFTESECRTCKGSGIAPWQWPPIKGQDVWMLGDDSEVFMDQILWISLHKICTIQGYDITLQDCFPTRELAEEYAAWRKERGL